MEVTLEQMLSDYNRATTSVGRTAAYKDLLQRLDSGALIKKYNMGKVEYLSSLGILPE